MKLRRGCGEQSKRTATLGRAIYIAKKSVRIWGHLCVYTLIADEFEKCKADPCIFLEIDDRVVVMIVGVYVDDLLTCRVKEGLPVVAGIPA